jgi:hypothetical protein
MIRQVHSFIWRIGHGEKMYGVIEEIILKQPFVDSSLKICLGEIHVITLGMGYYKFDIIIGWKFLEEFVSTIDSNHATMIVNIFVFGRNQQSRFATEFLAFPSHGVYYHCVSI